MIPLLLEKLDPTVAKDTAEAPAENCRRVLQRLDPGSYVDALAELVRRKGLEDTQSVLCNCFAMIAGGVVALAHDPAAQKDYCGTLTRIVGDLFRKDLVKVTVATDLLALATPVHWTTIQRSLLEGSLEALSSFCDAAKVTLPICAVVSVIPGKDAARAAKMVEQMAFDPLSPEGYLAQSGANGTQTAAQAVPEVALPPASQEPAEPTPMNLL